MALFEMSGEALTVVKGVEWFRTGIMPEGDEAMLPMIRNMLLDELCEICVVVLQSNLWKRVFGAVNSICQKKRG